MTAPGDREARRARLRELRRQHRELLIRTKLVAPRTHREMRLFHEVVTERLAGRESARPVETAELEGDR